MVCLDLLCIPLWLVLSLCIIILLYLYGKHPGTVWRCLGVPSPPAALFTGHMLKLFDPEKGMCNAFDKWEQQYGKIYGLLFFRKPVLVVSDLKSLKEILVKDFNNYTDHYVTGGESLLHPLMKKSLFFNKGKDWQRIRRIMTPSFSSSKLKLLVHHINATAEQLVQVLLPFAESGSHIEAKTVFSAFSLDVIAGTAFGLQLDSQKDTLNPFFLHAKNMTAVKKSVQLLMAFAGIFPVLGNLLKIFQVGFIDNEDIQFFTKAFTKLISERKANPEQVDFLQLLINAESDCEEDPDNKKKLTTEEIIAQSLIFIFAGYETTSATLQWMSYELAKNHEIQSKLREEIEAVVGGKGQVSYEQCQSLEYTEAVINETLRMYPPLHLLSRQTNSAATLGDIQIPAETAIVIPIFNIGRNPELFDDPNVFNPDRFMSGAERTTFDPTAFLPFGFGPRQCIGMRLAMMQMKIAVVHMLRVLTIQEATPKDVDIQDFTGFLIPKEAIQLSMQVN